jgi:ribosomal protein L40E
MAYLNSRPVTPKVCPVCGEDVPPRALACPECGADHRSGWKKEALLYDGLDMPEEEFDYDAFLQREFGVKKRASFLPSLWWITGVVLLLAWLLFWMIGG